MSATLVALFAIWVILVAGSLSSVSTSNECVRNLIAVPEYRAVRLKWTCDQTDQLVAFDVKLCEVTNWQSKNRCKEQAVSTIKRTENVSVSVDSDEPVIELLPPNGNTFEASVTNLRMLTNYSVSVGSQYGGSLATNVDTALAIHPQVFFETKSFAAKTSRCLANSSDIEVQTGPYFRGKISVEGSNNPLCAIYGNRASEQATYVLSINHDLCGSKLLNNSRIETMVIVHENKEILTHNSRRYMVVCTFAPEIYSLTASVAVPTHLLKKMFDRIREKQFQLSLTSARTEGKEATNVFNNEVMNSNNNNSPALVEKVGKIRRLPVKREEVRPSFSKQSHLRDSRMMAEDSHATRHKWMRRSDTDGDTEHRAQSAQSRGSKGFLATNNMALSLVMAICALALLWLGVGHCRHRRKVSNDCMIEREQRQKKSSLTGANTGQNH